MPIQPITATPVLKPPVLKPPVSESPVVSRRCDTYERGSHRKPDLMRDFKELERVFYSFELLRAGNTDFVLTGNIDVISEFYRLLADVIMANYTKDDASQCLDSQCLGSNVTNITVAAAA